MNPIYLILIGSVVLGFAEAYSSRGLKKHKEFSSTGFLIIGTIVSLVLNPLYMLIFGIQFTPLTQNTVLLIIILGIISYIANRLYYTSFKEEEAGVISVVMMFSIVVGTILGKLFFQETITFVQWLGILLVQ